MSDIKIYRKATPNRQRFLQQLAINVSNSNRTVVALARLAQRSEMSGSYELVGRSLRDLGREGNPECLGDLLIEHQLLNGYFLEWNIARLFAPQDTRQKF